MSDLETIVLGIALGALVSFAICGVIAYYSGLELEKRVGKIEQHLWEKFGEYPS